MNLRTLTNPMSITVWTYLLGLLFTVQFASCESNPKPQKSEKEMQELKEPLVEVNKFLVEKDYQLIKKYVERRGWEFQQTETGLWYQILNQGSETRVREGDEVKFKYVTSLLSGKTCYDSDSLGIRTLRIGHGDHEAGLDEAFQYLNYGDKARIILPPHLAFGLIGDENCIPSRSIVMYEVEVLSQQKY
jgi:FKBP-type peptidyl-prolyl cis-trans isomerase FkpA